MRTGSLILFLALLAAPLGAQQRSITVNTGTAEGQLMQQIGDAQDDAIKIQLAEQFLAKYPKHDGAPWVYSQMLASCTKLGQFDKALDAAEKMLAQNPADLESAFAAVKAAEAKKDPDAVRKWAVLSSDLARKRIQAPKAQEEDDDAFKQRVEFAKQLDTYTEYALYATALQAPEPKQKAELLKTLEDRSPESKYLSQAYGLYFLALLQSGQTPAAVAVAEKSIAKGEGTEEMLGTASDFYLHQNTEPQKVLDYSAKLLELVNTRPKPDGVSDADWQKRQNYFLGWGQWMMGAVFASQGKFKEADKTLRAALPLLEGNDETKAGALFNLGAVNQKLNNLADAVRFYEQCSAITSPYQSMAANNLKGIKAAYRVIK